MKSLLICHMCAIGYWLLIIIICFLIDIVIRHNCVVSLSIFTSCAVFWRARRVNQSTNNEKKLSVIPHNKTSYKRLIIQHTKLFLLELQSNLSLAHCEKTCRTSPLEYNYRMIFVLILGVICTLQSAVR